MSITKNVKSLYKIMSKITFYDLKLLNSPLSEWFDYQRYSVMQCKSYHGSRTVKAK